MTPFNNVNKVDNVKQWRIFSVLAFYEMADGVCGCTNKRRLLSIDWLPVDLNFHTFCGGSTESKVLEKS